MRIVIPCPISEHALNVPKCGHDLGEPTFQGQMPERLSTSFDFFLLKKVIYYTTTRRTSQSKAKGPKQQMLNTERTTKAP